MDESRLGLQLQLQLQLEKAFKNETESKPRVGYPVNISRAFGSEV